jgi:hypothetical protein
VLLTLKYQLVNPALRMHPQATLSGHHFEVLNDTDLDIPYTVPSSSHYLHTQVRSHLAPGPNLLKFASKAANLPVASLKASQLRAIQSAIKMRIPGTEVTLCDFNPPRPRSALLRESRSGVCHSGLREKISARAPVRVGDVGVKQLREVCARDYMQEESRFLRHEVLREEELPLLQINFGEKGYVVTNSHPSKDICVRVVEKGYLLLQSGHSWVIPYEKKWLRLEHNGKLLEVQSKEVDDKQPYKIRNRELLFCFAQAQKEFEVRKKLEVVNRSAQPLAVHCLSVDDEYFHSLEPDHKILVPPRATAHYALSFRPGAESSSSSGKVTRELVFLIDDSRESITCEGDLLPATVSLDVKSLVFADCPYS